MKKIIASTAIVVAGLSAGSAAALSYDKSNGAFGPPGSALALGTETVDPAKVGKTCAVTVDIGNNESVRSGSTITVSSGTSHVFADVEAVAGDRPSETVKLVLGPTVSASLTFGPEGMFSGTGTITVGDCEVPPAPPVTPPTPPVSPTPVVTPPSFTG